MYTYFQATVEFLVLSKMLKIKEPETFMQCRLHGNQNSSGLQCEVAY